MRLSISSDSPFWDKRAHGARVFLGGTLIRHCVEASEEDGFAIVSLKGDDGRTVLSVDSEGEQRVAYARVEGPIRIEVRPPT